MQGRRWGLALPWRRGNDPQSGRVCGGGHEGRQASSPWLDGRPRGKGAPSRLRRSRREGRCSFSVSEGNVGDLGREPPCPCPKAEQVVPATPSSETESAVPTRPLPNGGGRRSRRHQGGNDAERPRVAFHAAHLPDRAPPAAHPAGRWDLAATAAVAPTGHAPWPPPQHRVGTAPVPRHQSEAVARPAASAANPTSSPPTHQ